MNSRLFLCAAALCSLSCFSLIGAPLLSNPVIATSMTIEEDELLSNVPDTIFYDNTLVGQDDIIAAEASDDALDLPFEEADSNIEEQTPTATDANVQPNLQKVLYDPKLNYGTGSPIPKAAPLTTTKRNLIVLGSSLIMATVAMLVVSSNKGLDASYSH